MFKISLAMHTWKQYVVRYTCVRYLLYFISDTLQDAEKDKEETEYMLQENGKPMYDFSHRWTIFLLNIKKIYITRNSSSQWLKLLWE